MLINSDTAKLYGHTKLAALTGGSRINPLVRIKLNNKVSLHRHPERLVISDRPILLKGRPVSLAKPSSEYTLAGRLS